VVGPSVSDTAQATRQGGIPATWTIDLYGKAGSVPLSSEAFTTIDRFGRVYRLTVARTRRLPTQILAGKRLQLRLGTAMLPGEGRMRWIPQGHLAPVEWSFALETH
jgi:hypothetical protein